MRYVVQFFDRTSKRVDMLAAKQFMQAHNSGNPVFFKGNTYSGKSISSIRTIFGFYQDRAEQASSNGKFFCKYGHEHAFRLDCGCKDANFKKMFTPEELVELPLWNEEKEQQQAQLLMVTSKQLA
jgi:hypothetical protein